MGFGGHQRQGGIGIGRGMGNRLIMRDKRKRGGPGGNERKKRGKVG